MTHAAHLLPPSPPPTAQLPLSLSHRTPWLLPATTSIIFQATSVTPAARLLPQLPQIAPPPRLRLPHRLPLSPPATRQSMYVRVYTACIVIIASGARLMRAFGIVFFDLFPSHRLHSLVLLICVRVLRRRPRA